jgi:hypothetical protein
VGLFDDGEILANEVGEGTRNEGHGAAMGGIMLSAIDLEDKAANIAEQDDATTRVGDSA